jgi:hypothetical protein
VIQRLKELVERVEGWPKQAQEDAVASLETIEEEYFGVAELSADDIEALEQSAEDIRLDRFASEAEVREVFRSFQQK